ncbi:hypothetical protein ACFQ07_29320 [Actinomadura adrarensis]|uniref:DUF533 domain-containing protein n=1 Tax=Actinomadura adrarensis TaxID=1819600 RepID=A0ABW3CPR3_9ACTN
MAINDRVVAALYARLARQWDEHERLMGTLSKEEINGPMVDLITAAFVEAARRRFLKEGVPASDAEVIDYIAFSRSKSEAAADRIDPILAEKQINLALQKVSPDVMKDVDADTAFDNQVFLLSLLVADGDYGDDELSELLQRSREMAEELF